MSLLCWLAWLSLNCPHLQRPACVWISQHTCTAWQRQLHSFGCCQTFRRAFPCVWATIYLPQLLHVGGLLGCAAYKACRLLCLPICHVSIHFLVHPALLSVGPYTALMAAQPPLCWCIAHARAISIQILIWHVHASWGVLLMLIGLRMRHAEVGGLAPAGVGCTHGREPAGVLLSSLRSGRDQRPAAGASADHACAAQPGHDHACTLPAGGELSVTVHVHVCAHASASAWHACACVHMCACAGGHEADACVCICMHASRIKSSCMYMRHAIQYHVLMYELNVSCTEWLCGVHVHVVYSGIARPLLQPR